VLIPLLQIPRPQRRPLVFLSYRIVAQARAVPVGRVQRTHIHNRDRHVDRPNHAFSQSCSETPYARLHQVENVPQINGRRLECSSDSRRLVFGPVQALPTKITLRSVAYVTLIALHRSTGVEILHQTSN
jgi:hypothetical protein